MAERPASAPTPAPPPPGQVHDNPQWELLKGRLRELFREPGVLFWVFGFPLLMALCLGIAFRSQPAELPLVAVVRAPADAAGSPSASSPAATSPSASRVDVAQLERALLASERLKARRLDPAAAREALAHAKVDLIVELGEGPARFIFDPLQSKAPLARLTTSDVLQRAAGRVDPVATEDLTTQEQGSRYVDFLIPGLIGLNIMGSSMWSIGFNLVIARKRKLLRRYAVTPMKRSHFLLSYFYTRLLALALELVLLVSFGVLLFGTAVQGSWLALVLTAVLGAGSFAGISLIIGARLENSETASGWMNLVQLPMWVLSGTFFSYERFPEVVHPLIELLPLTALVNGLRAVYNEGAGVLQIGPELLVLLLWGALGYTVALRSFRWQ